MDVTFYFDPGCPWTWRTSRWLLRAAAARDVGVRWRPFSLSILNPDPPEDHKALMAASRRALRVIAALAEQSAEAPIAHFYAELGARSHERDARLTDAAVEEALAAAGLDELRDALDDEACDAEVRRWHGGAWESAGPDVGSPVLWLAGAPRAMHGPILAEVPSEAASADLFDALLPLLRDETFYEVKRGRR